MGLLHKYKEYLLVNDRTNIAIKTVGGDPLVVRNSEAAVMDAIHKLEGMPG
jgi:hypothetical protein